MRNGSATSEDSNARAASRLGRACKRLSDVPGKPLEWIWEGLIPRGKLTLITGEPGIGKSLFALQVVSMVTRGGRDPFRSAGVNGDEAVRSSEAQRTNPGDVLIFSADDDPADTLRPRLEAADADLTRVILLSPELSMEDEARADGRDIAGDAPLTRLETVMESLAEEGVTPQLIVLDPIDAFLNPIRRRSDRAMVVARLVALAARSGAAIIVIANSTSSRIGRAGYRQNTIGNQELANSARAVLMVAQDLENDHRRLVLPVKLNLGANRPGLAFVIEGNAVTWNGDPIALTGDEYVTQANERLKSPLVREECSELDRVTHFLKHQLSEGYKPSVEVRMAAAENYIAYSTLRRAFRRLGCRTTKLGAGAWYWWLPGVECGSHSQTSDTS
ncbi:AAA family ATPase [Schlesneria paludicola]|uniref:AAA family ATPase n=1 Tax=Schlesneria paludicola TaxID=360056 RepID=UPI0002DEC408|nr:AAA family ATPase [Schlesneria paludicola]